MPTKKDYQGATDKCVGSWLKGRNRQDVIIASKVPTGATGPLHFHL